MPTVRADLELAQGLADRVDALTMARFGAADLVVSSKPDLTPVTDADRDAEALIRAALAGARPEDAVLGEEYGETGRATRRWIVDPIDGTKNFVRGVPVWATLIALYDGDTPIVGVVSAPALGRRWWAGTGLGAFVAESGAGERRCRVSDVADLTDASLSYSSLTGWAERGLLPAFVDLTQRVWRTRGYGDFWSYMLVAEGAVDLACEPEVSLWDLAAPAVVVGEAGGRFTDLSGRSGPGGGSAVASNGRLHDRLLEALGGSPGR